MKTLLAPRRYVPAVATGLLWALSLVAGGAGSSPSEERYEFDALMRGGGRGDADATYSFALWCEPDGRSNDLVVRWSRVHTFVLRRVRNAVCDGPGPAERTSATTNVDTLRGEGSGSYDGVDGAHAAWTLTDGGGLDADRAEITITDARGAVVLHLAGALKADHQASGHALLPVTPGIDPDNMVHTVVIDANGRTTLSVRTPLAADAMTDEPAEEEQKPDAIDPVPSPRVHPDLEQLISDRPSDERAVVIVSLQDELTVPRLPDLPRGVSRHSPAGARVSMAHRVMVGRLSEQRRTSVETFLERAAPLDLRLVQHFWLTSGFVADARLGDIRTVAALPEVRFVELAQSGVAVTAPHHNGGPDYPPHADVAAGRALIGTDAYYNLSGMTDGYIGLIDSGVNSNHKIFYPFSPGDDNLGLVADCVHGGWNCSQSGNPGFDASDCANHGTSTAAILAGSSNMGSALRGVTDIVVDSWRVYAAYGDPKLGKCSLDTAAGKHAIEVAVAAFDRVLAVLAQDNGGHEGILSRAADSAFDAGAVVVAATGNCAVSDDCTQRVGTARSGTVRAPASARKVIGVGDFNVVDLKTRDYQGFGPTPDGRVKPDIQAPTDVKTAERSGFSAVTERFGGTSAATPFAAGAAAHMRSWLRKFNTFDPGFTYARIILSGTAIWRKFFGYWPKAGAGHLRLPAPCELTANWGKVTIPRPARGRAPVWDIPIKLTSGDSLAAAIWWPETIGRGHDDIDLYILDPNGVEQAAARSANSVWERTEVDGPLAPGIWTIRIKGANITEGRNSVYWTADVRKACPRELPSGEPPR